MTGGTWPTRALESKASEQKSSSLSEFVSASGKEPCLILWVPGSPLNSLPPNTLINDAAKLPEDHPSMGPGLTFSLFQESPVLGCLCPSALNILSHPCFRTWLIAPLLCISQGSPKNRTNRMWIERERELF